MPTDMPARPSRLTGVRNAFFTGLFLLAPLGVSFFVVKFLLDNIGEPAGDFFFGWLKGELPGPGVIAVNLLSIVIVVALITTLGYASRYLLGKWMLRNFERVVLHVPLVGLVYRTTKQIVDTFRSQQHAVFQKVVLVQFPREGVYSIGFLTHTAEGEVQARTGETMVNIFIPTTPNPTSGFLVVCPLKDVVLLDMSVGDGMKLIISGGAVVPAYAPAVQPVATLAPRG